MLANREISDAASWFRNSMLARR